MWKQVDQKLWVIMKHPLVPQTYIGRTWTAMVLISESGCWKCAHWKMYLLQIWSCRIMDKKKQNDNNKKPKNQNSIPESRVGAMEKNGHSRFSWRVESETWNLLNSHELGFHSSCPAGFHYWNGCMITVCLPFSSFHSWKLRESYLVSALPLM